MYSIKFAHNYNNKLLCLSFTTIRLRDDAKYKVGDFYDVYYQWKDPEQQFVEKENYLGKARILDIRHFLLHELSVFMSHIDMNLHHFEGRKELRKIYSDPTIDWNTQQLSYILIEMEDGDIRYIMPDRIKRIDRKADLFSNTLCKFN